MGNIEARSFYEIEAAQQNWSVSQLSRQVGSSLYERLALSRNKVTRNSAKSIVGEAIWIPLMPFCVTNGTKCAGHREKYLIFATMKR